MNFLANLEKRKSTWILLVIAFLFFLLRLPSLFEPNWYGDEGIYEVIGKALRNGRILYSGIWDNKPPLLYYIYAIFSGDQFSIRLLSIIVGLISIIIFFCLAKKIFHPEKTKAVYAATAVFSFLFATPFLEGNIANAENFILLPIILAGLLVYSSTHKSKRKQLNNRYTFFIAGILLGIAFLIKIVAIFDFAAFALFIFILEYKNLINIINQIKTLLPFAYGFFLPFVVFIIYFLIRGNLSSFIHSSFTSNVGYVGYGNTFIIPQGLLIVKLLLLGFFSLFIFLKRHRFSPSQMFIFLWFSFSIFNMLFSQRPFTHYVLVTIASFSLLAGCIIFEKAHKLGSGMLLILFVLTVFWNFSLLGHIPRTIHYYGNFLMFIFQRESLENYYAFFDPIVLRDYQLAQYINIHKTKKDTVFIWGNSGQLYMLTNTLPIGRYIVAYHMTASKKTMKETSTLLSQKQPNYIVILPHQPTLPFSLSNYTERYADQDGSTIYEKIY